MTQFIDWISQLFYFRHLMKKMIFMHINTKYILIDILPLVMKSKSICVLLKLLYCIFSSIFFIAKQIIVDICNKGTCSLIKFHRTSIKISLVSVVVWWTFITKQVKVCVVYIYKQYTLNHLWMVRVQREYKKGLVFACRL